MRKPEEGILKVVHLQNIRWEDDDATADENHFTDIDRMIKSMKKYHDKEEWHPIIVHCSAGIGRTGTLLAIFAIIESVEKNDTLTD